ncbi:stimulated by retinoic acid gene 6 protein-like [Exaiptasia diaphana]|uniref:Uncharacterized protein n=1 Tax=Exaiptasia diaphana TaxID=2652724 RepID=A0A913WSM7_EXADI|nr:stimulated by retinoic acid gene 6 protein-like [Exaiptasia diaphana]
MVGVGQIVGLLLNLRTFVVANKLVYIISSGPEVYQLLVKFLNILIVSFLVSILVSAIYMYFQMYRMLVSHRNHVIKLIKGDRRFLPNSLSDPHIMVGMSLRFAGYQVAYFIWGFLLVAFVLLVTTLFISALVLFLPLVFEDDLEDEFAKVALAFVPTVGMAILVFVVQQILARFVFKDRSMVSKVVNVHNR